VILARLEGAVPKQQVERMVRASDPAARRAAADRFNSGPALFFEEVII